MPPKKSKPKESPAEQHKRFVEIAKKLEASEAAEDFDRAFKRVALSKLGRAQSSRGASSKSGRGR